MRLVGDDDNVGAVREHGHRLLALARLELLDQREDVAVVSAEQLPQMSDGGGMHLRLRRHSPGVSELAVKLVIQLLAVGNHHERPCTRDLA